MSNEIEQEIRAKGLTAPRITLADVEANIASEHYFTAMDGAEYGGPNKVSYATDPIPICLGLLTFCVLTLRNGFTVTGESACASPENFDPVIGKRIARLNAIEKMWPLLGFRLRDRLAGRG